MGLAAQETTAPFPQLRVLIEGWATPLALSQSTAWAVSRRRQSSRRANAGSSQVSHSVHRGLDAHGSHICAREVPVT